MTENVLLTTMKSVVRLNVPLKVDTGYGPTWYQAH